MGNTVNPWLSISTYEEKDAFRFKGRECDTENVFTLLKQNEYIVLYASSGNGKSSLINAGLCPIMEKNAFLPIRITFTTDEYEGKMLPYLDKNNEKVDFDKLILGKINDGIVRYRQRFIEKYNINDDEFVIGFERNENFSEICLDKDSLWWKLRTEHIHIPLASSDFMPVLIFDQFEELLSSKWCADFFQWFEMFSKDICPDDLINFLGNSLEVYPNTKYAKFIFSLRQEYIGELDYWIAQKYYIPLMSQARYFLKPLNSQQAISIIKDQGVDTLDLVVEDIIEELKEDRNDEIPAILLSVYCYKLFEKAKILPNGKKKQIQKDEMLENKDSLIKEHYESILVKCKIRDKDIDIIEDCLVQYGRRRRVDLSNEKRLDKIKFKDLYLNDLRDNYILKVDNNSNYKAPNERDENLTIEIAHDKLADVIALRQSTRRYRKLMVSLRVMLLMIPIVILAILFCLYLTPSDIPRLNDQEFVYSGTLYISRNDGTLDGKTLLITSPLFFEQNSFVENIVLDKEYATFKECPNLSKIEITSNTNLKLESCGKLRKLIISDNVDNISISIKECNSLKKIKIPVGLKEIRNEYGITSRNLVFDIDSMNKNFYWDNGVLWNNDSIIFINESLLQQNRIEIPLINGKDSIIFNNGERRYVVYNLDLNKFIPIINIDGALMPSPHYGFYKSIDLSNFEVKNIEEGAFKNCDKLEYIKLPNGIERIGQDAFYGCRELQEISLPNSLKSIYPRAFAFCI